MASLMQLGLWRWVIFPGISRWTGDDLDCFEDAKQKSGRPNKATSFRSYLPPMSGECWDGLLLGSGCWFQPLWKLWVRQLGLWHSQYMESQKIHVPNHQPGFTTHYFEFVMPFSVCRWASHHHGLSSTTHVWVDIRHPWNTMTYIQKNK